MNRRSKVLEIANHMADRVKSDKRPYASLQWISENCSGQYGASKSEVREAYFAAVNILKQDGVENSKRRSLSTLSRTQKARMRKQAKNLAAMIEGFLKTPVEVTRSPIKTYQDGEARIQIGVKSGVNWCCISFFYPTFEELGKWSSFEEASKVTFAYELAQQFKPTDGQIKDDIETIKANLECLL